MVTLENFSENQRNIIERDFVRSKIWAEGTSPPDYMTSDGVRIEYGALLRHPDYIAEPVEEFSQRIASLTLSLYCPKNDVHTGLVQYRGDESKEVVLRLLADATHKSLRELQSPHLNYDRWYCNQDSVIVAGQADQAFVDIANSIMTNYQGSGIRVKWGSQITANRFTERRSPEELQEFFELMKSAPRLGLSRPTILDVISQTISKNDSIIETYERFTIPL